MSRARRGRLGLSPADIFGAPVEVKPPPKKAVAAPKPKAKPKAKVGAPEPSVAVTAPSAFIATAANQATSTPESQVWRAGYLLGLTLARVLGALRRLRGWPGRRKS